jgi:hypothetical protein
MNLTSFMFTETRILILWVHPFLQRLMDQKSEFAWQLWYDYCMPYIYYWLQKKDQKKLPQKDF